MQSNLYEHQAAKAAAKRIFQKVNFSGGPLQSYQISSLLTDTYEYLKISFQPTSRDLRSYTQVLDANRDGQVTLTDLETLAVQYLCGPGVQSNQIKSSFTNSKTKIQPATNSYSRSRINSQLQTKYNGVAAQSKSVNQQKQFRKSNQYTEQIKQYILITKSIFQRHADERFTITADKVPQLLSQTYEAMGRKGFKSNKEDVVGWMNLCDGNGDGHVEYQQYEYFVVRSIQRSGFLLYK